MKKFIINDPNISTRIINATIKNRVFIDKRPKIVEQKQRAGDWEIDTIIGKNNKKAIEFILNNPSWKLSIQSHKYIGVQ